MLWFPVITNPVICSRGELSLSAEMGGAVGDGVSIFTGAGRLGRVFSRSLMAWPALGKAARLCGENKKNRMAPCDANKWQCRFKKVITLPVMRLFSLLRFFLWLYIFTKRIPFLD